MKPRRAAALLGLLILFPALAWPQRNEPAAAGPVPNPALSVPRFSRDDLSWARAGQSGGALLYQDARGPRLPAEGREWRRFHLVAAGLSLIGTGAMLALTSRGTRDRNITDMFGTRTIQVYEKHDARLAAGIALMGGGGVLLIKNTRRRPEKRERRNWPMVIGGTGLMVVGGGFVWASRVEIGHGDCFDPVTGSLYKCGIERADVLLPWGIGVLGGGIVLAALGLTR